MIALQPKYLCDESPWFRLINELSLPVMTSSPKGILIATVAFLAMGSTAWADARPNPYDPIVTRNPFGIKPPPPAAAPEQAPQPPLNLAKVVLTGITTIMGPKPQALLEVTEQEQGK